MSLTLILGPMKSAKSLDLASHMLPFAYTNMTHGVFHPCRNLRDDNKEIRSRSGVCLPAQKIKSISEILKMNPRPKFIGIDEVHMFPEKDAEAVRRLLCEDSAVFCAGLDLDYRGVMFPIIRRLLSLGPREVRFKRAVCEHCHTPEAVFTQVYEEGKPILKGKSPVIPDDGTGRFTYEPLCRHCFQYS